MSIYIPGMEMPKTCGECKMHFLGHPDYVCCSITDRIPKSIGRYKNSQTDLGLRKESILLVQRPDWCPLISVPPHGRLIDADELKKESQYSSFLYENEKIIFESDIDDIPTIIPAEPPKEEV